MGEQTQNGAILEQFLGSSPNDPKVAFARPRDPQSESQWDLGSILRSKMELKWWPKRRTIQHPKVWLFITPHAYRQGCKCPKSLKNRSTVNEKSSQNVMPKDHHFGTQDRLGEDFWWSFWKLWSPHWPPMSSLFQQKCGSEEQAKKSGIFVCTVAGRPEASGYTWIWNWIGNARISIWVLNRCQIDSTSSRVETNTKCAHQIQIKTIIESTST